MNRFILILFVCFLGLPTIAQKVYWNSPYGKVNLPLGGLKNVKDLIKKEFVFPISTILEDVIDIKYKIDKNGIATITSMTGVNNSAIKHEAKRLFLKIRFSPYSKRTENDLDDLIQFTFSKKASVKLYNKRGYQEIEYPYTPIDSTEKLYKYQFIKEKPKPIFSKKDNYNSFNNYIMNKLEYPTDALKMGLKGQVVVSFVIEQSGQISNVTVLEPLAAGCTEEALRLIKSLKWYPAIVNEKAVRTQMTSSIGFGVSSSTYQESFNQGR